MREVKNEKMPPRRREGRLGDPPHPSCGSIAPPTPALTIGRNPRRGGLLTDGQIPVKPASKVGDEALIPSSRHKSLLFRKFTTLTIGQVHKYPLSLEKCERIMQFFRLILLHPHPNRL
jgi:hypothetical protein